jgi:hypothetical protein
MQESRTGRGQELTSRGQELAPSVVDPQLAGEALAGTAAPIAALERERRARRSWVLSHRGPGSGDVLFDGGLRRTAERLQPGQRRQLSEPGDLERGDLPVAAA